MAQANDYESSSKWYFIIAFSIAWVSFVCAILYAYFDKNTASTVFYIIGSLGPIIAPLSLMLTFQNKRYNKDFWIRAYNPKIGPMWLVLSAIITPIILNFLPVLFSIGSGTVFTLGNYLSGHGLFMVFTLCGVIGWFGYAFPLLRKRLEEPREYKFKVDLGRFDRFIERVVLKAQNIHKRASWFFAGLIIGIMWSVWFIPVAFIVGTSELALGANFAFWEFLVLLPIQSIIISWVYAKTPKSTFIVLIFFLADITYIFFSISWVFQLIRIMLWALVLVAILLNEYVFHIVKIPESQ